MTKQTPVFMEECLYFANVSKVPETVAKFFFKRMKILIVEEDKRILDSLEGFFSTPYIRVETAMNGEDALLAISSSPMPWHCWIIDMNPGRSSGRAILKKHEQFPFTIIYSGTGSMELAAEAVKLGAAEVIDKNPDSIYKLIVKTCKLIPLSFISKGFLHNNRSVFFLLKEHIIENHNDWASRANLSLRQLQNICGVHTGMPPTYVIPLYYGLQYVMLKSFNFFEPPIEYSLHQSFFVDCLDFIDQNLSYYQKFR